MWVFLNDAFLSIVKHRTEDVLLVRSRVEGDIERAIPSASVFTDDKSDYRFRALVTKEVLKEALAAKVDAIEYDNFKNSVPDRRRHDAYMDVWSAMAKEYGAYGRKP